jgi:hypothetical protein
VSFTVVPLHNLDLPEGSRIPFGAKFIIQDIPEWVKKDTGTLNDLARDDRRSVLRDKQALVSEYEAHSYGHPDPDWKGTNPKGIQELRYQSAFLANVAIWLVQPSPLCFTAVFHALTRLDGRELDEPIINRTDRQGPFYCHPDEQSNKVTWQQLVEAAKLFEALDAIPRNNAVWSGLRALSGALASYYADYRYPLFWQGLESLFGSDTDKGQISERLRSRISLFIADTPKGGKEIYDMVKACYAMRSEILHGRWENDPAIDARMTDTESIVRTVLRNLIDTPALLAIFTSKKRNTFLKAWETSKSFAPPPMP